MPIKKIKIGSAAAVDINDARDVIIGDGVENVVALTTAEYAALTTKDPDTVYVVTDDSGTAEFIALTTAQYEAITTKDPSTLYLITDATGTDVDVIALTTSAYEALTTKDPDTLYIITDASSGGGGSGEENVIEIVKVNGTALTPDANKAVDVTVPTKVSDLTNDSGFITDSGVVKTSGNQTISGTKTFSSEVQMTAGGTSDITYGVACAFKTNIAQITNFATQNILSGGTNSTTPITFYKYTAVSSQAPSSLVQLAKIDTDGNIYEGTTKLSDKYLSDVTFNGVSATVTGGTAAITATIPTVPTISTNISSDASSDTKTAPPKAVKNYVDSIVGDIETLLAAI